MTIEDGLEERVAELLKINEPSLASHLGVRFTHFSLNKVIATMPVDGRTKQPYGILHGGANVVLAETLASVAARLNVDDTLYSLVGIEINANHLRSVKTGLVTEVTTPIHLGKKTHVWDIRINDGSDKLTCISRCTLAIIDKR